MSWVVFLLFNFESWSVFEIILEKNFNFTKNFWFIPIQFQILCDSGNYFESEL